MMPDYRKGNPYQQLLANALEKAGVSVFFPQGYRRILPIFRAIWNQNSPVDILHLHWLQPYINRPNPYQEFIYTIKFLIDILLTRLRGTRLIWTVHNQIEHDTILPHLERWIRQILINVADSVIVHNHSTLECLSQEYTFPKEKVTVIAHGHYRTIYSPEINQNEARHHLNLSVNRRLYLHLGALRPYKGIEHLLEVWQANKVSLSNSLLLIAGCTYDQNYTNQLNALTQQCTNVILHPQFIEDKRIHLYLSAADVVVLPYTRILTSGSVILAMSYGKPVIAPRLGSIPETLGDADWLLYDPDDPQGLCHAIQKSLTCCLENLSRLTVQSCDRLEWGSIGIQTAQCYQRSLLKRSAPSQTPKSI